MTIPNETITVERALQMAESDRWYGQGTMREVAAVLAKEVRRYQDIDPSEYRCSVRADSGDRCRLHAEHSGNHEVG